ncbi:hypothetical protein CPC08DRAFT_218274 [Agrocybe pediades]|nr:hypothetical protein CPC08DRAFT_218274 [Agrocybe pediades]
MKALTAGRKRRRWQPSLLLIHPLFLPLLCPRPLLHLHSLASLRLAPSAPRRLPIDLASSLPILPAIRRRPYRPRPRFWLVALYRLRWWLALIVTHRRCRPPVSVASLSASGESEARSRLWHCEVAQWQRMGGW